MLKVISGKTQSSQANSSLRKTGMRYGETSISKGKAEPRVLDQPVEPKNIY